MSDTGRRPERRFWKPDVARDVDDELKHHLEMRQQELAARGLDPVEARDIALRRFGNVNSIAAACREIDERWYREQRRASMWMDLRHDVAYALRMLRKSPAFTIVAVVTLALGIGATTAIFTAANWTLFRPVPGVLAPEEVRVVWTGRWSERGMFTVSFVSYPNYLDVARRLTTIGAIAGYQPGDVAVASAHEPGRPISAEFVSAAYFDLLGVRFRAGRPFTIDEDNPGAGAQVAVISDRLWASMFGRSDSVFREPIRLNGIPFTVIGVTAPEFHGTHRVSLVDLWMPGSTYPIVNHQKARADSRSAGSFYHFIVRRAAGATWPQVEAELKSLGPWLASLHPAENRKFNNVTFHLLGAIGLDPHPSTRARLSELLWVMLGASALVLLIACSNVASLLSIRGLGRRTEVAMRHALGASRLRLVRQHVTEGTLLWAIGAAGGIAIVWFLTRSIDVAPLLNLRVMDADAPPLDWRVLTFTAGISLIVGLCFSLFPAFRAARATPAETLRHAAPTTTVRSFTGGSALTVFQMAASLTLLVGALLLGATVRHLGNLPLGFDPDGIVAFFINPARLGYSPAATLAYAREFERRLATTPGVESVALAEGAPFMISSSTRIRRLGGTAEDVIRTRVNRIASPTYFATVGIALRRGRLFDAADIGEDGGRSRPVVIVSERLALDMFGTIDAVGRAVEFPVLGREHRTYEVIGVVADARSSGIEEMESVVYEPPALDDAARPASLFVVRTSSSNFAAEVRNIAAALNSALPVGVVQRISTVIDRSRSEWIVLSRLMNALAVIASILAAVGLYGVLAAAVAQRRREFGIRMALGAAPAAVIGLVMRRSGAITIAGLVFGMGGAAVLVRTIEARLVGVQKFDLTLWSAAGLMLVAIAGVASLLPALRATRVDVTETLRAL